MIKLLNWLIKGSVEYIYQYVSRAQLHKWIILMKEKFKKKKTNNILILLSFYNF